MNTFEKTKRRIFSISQSKTALNLPTRFKGRIFHSSSVHFYCLSSPHSIPSLPHTLSLPLSLYLPLSHTPLSSLPPSLLRPSLPPSLSLSPSLSLPSLSVSELKVDIDMIYRLIKVPKIPDRPLFILLIFLIDLAAKVT